MGKLYQEKVVSSLPSTLVANTLYYVKNGAGFDMYLTNKVGTVVAYPLNVGSSGGSSYVPNRTFMESWSNETSHGTTASLVKSFNQYTINAGKSLYVETSMSLRNDLDSWGGFYHNLNVNVNGAGWTNLGNSGYNGGVMIYSGREIRKTNHGMYFDFIEHFGLDANLPYTVEFELYGKSYSGTTKINPVGNAHNEEGSGLNVRGVVPAWVKNQNFSRIIFQEIDELTES